jgi:hypothetical protein
VRHAPVGCPCCHEAFGDADEDAAPDGVAPDGDEEGVGEGDGVGVGVGLIGPTSTEVKISGVSG